jgi:general secretion pathway protein B
MSFILDALKKSEMERQRQSLPGLMDTRASPRRSRLPLWAMGLGLLLLVNLLVLTFVLWHKNSPTARATGPAEASSTHSTDAAPPVTNHFSPLDTAPVYAPEIPVAAADRPLAPALPARSAPSGDSGRVDGSAGSAERAPRHTDPVLIDEDAQSDNQDVLPTISEISLSGAQAIPELHLDVHVYATRPAERFVYINMRKYHEGATLQEGPTVEHIRRDGVVLNYQGLRFILPRQP